MGLDTAKYLNRHEDDPTQSAARETGWQEVTDGLRYILQGYLFLLAVATLGAGVVWLAATDWAGALGLAQRPQDRDTLLLLGVAVLFGGGVCGVALFLFGQWHCLMHAPQRQAAKEMMLVCFTCLCLGSVLGLAALFVVGAGLRQAPGHAPANPESQGLALGETVLPPAAGVVVLVGMLAFTQFLRVVASSFGDRVGARGADLATGLAGLLLGASLGAPLCAYHLGLEGLLVPWLVAGWTLWFLGHLWNIAHVRRKLGAVLRRLTNTSWTRPAGSRAVGVLTNTLSGLRRLSQEASR